MTPPREITRRIGIGAKGTQPTTGRPRDEYYDPLNSESTCKDMLEYMQKFHLNNGQRGDDWHLVDNPIGFSSDAQKANWTMAGDKNDVKGMMTVSHFIKHPWGNGESTYKIALFCS